MHLVPDYQIISAPGLVAPLAVLLLASINALLESGGRASRNAFVISKAALFVAAAALVAVVLIGPQKFIMNDASGLAVSLSFGPASSALLVTACAISLLIAKGTVSQKAAGSVKNRIARWNIAVLTAVSAMVLSGNAIAMGIGCIFAVMGLIKADAVLPGIMPVLSGSSEKNTA